MGKKKYVAYVGTYTHGTSKGIQVYDVDVENGTLTERSEVEVSNASHLAVSKNGKYLYSIEDEGVAVFERDENGDLSRINSVDINGMRGCYLATDVDGRYLLTSSAARERVALVLSVSVMMEDLHIFFLSSAMRLRYTAMTEAARTRSSSCSRVLPLLEKKTPMMRFTTQHQACLFLRMANIFSAQLQVRTQ